MKTSTVTTLYNISTKLIFQRRNNQQKVKNTLLVQMISSVTHFQVHSFVRLPETVQATRKKSEKNYETSTACALPFE